MTLITHLIIVSNEIEAKKVVQYLKRKDTLILSTSLEAEFSIKQQNPSYENPIYNFLNKDASFIPRKYTFPNFKVSYKFCEDHNIRYARDRIGDYLAELDRSIDFAKLVLSKVKPQKVTVGSIRDYSGSSVIDANLKPHAFYLICKEKHINVKVLMRPDDSITIKRKIGEFIQKIRSFKKQKLKNRNTDLLILATPRHLIQMNNVINSLKKSGLMVEILTYSVNVKYKFILDSLYKRYYEKNKLVENKFWHYAYKKRGGLIENKVWNNFSHIKYKGDPIILKYMRSKIKNIIETEIVETFLDKHIAQKVLMELKPKALLTTTDPDAKILPYVDTAKSLNMKTICIQHGAFDGSGSPAIYPTSDYFITWSNYFKKTFLKINHFKKRHLLVGHSPFHKQIYLKAKPRSELIKILFLASIEITDNNIVDFYYKKLFDLLETYDNVKLYIRVHPYQNTRDLHSLIKNSNLESSFENEVPLIDIIKQVDIVIFQNTTAGFDAMLYGKPTIFFNPHGRKDFYNAGRNEACLSILSDNDFDKIANFIDNIELRNKYSKNARAFAMTLLGLNNSSKNKISAILKNLLRT